MAHIYRPLYTREIPPGAAKFVRKGVELVRWRARGGREVVARVSKTNPTKCLVESGVWWISYRDHFGREVRVAGTADRAATQVRASDLARVAARIKAGVLPVSAAKTRCKLSELVSRWAKFLSDSGNSAKHVATQTGRVNRVILGVGASHPSEIVPVAVLAWVAKEKRKEADKRRDARGMLLKFGATTASHHVGAVKAFTRWLAVVDGSEPIDYLSALVRESDSTDPRYSRRALGEDEFRRLIQSTEAGGEVRGLTGPERAALYQIAAGTGLRASELASLVRESFTFGPSPSVTVEAAYSKRRRRDTLPLASFVVEAVRSLVESRGVGDKIWPDRTGTDSSRWQHTAAEMIRVDLAAAGIDAVAGGRVFDFHALRSQFATDLERAGVSLGRAQKLMRHSTPLLTAKNYTRPEQDELAADLEKLTRGRGRITG